MTDSRSTSTTPTWLDDQRDRFISKLVAARAEDLRGMLGCEAARVSKLFASPIEIAFWLAWLEKSISEHGSSFPAGALPIPQQETIAGGKKYRIDFAFLQPEIGVRVAVELDGHDFHERTPEQVESRNQRDADLQSSGWIVLHFSGRQILRDPSACIARVDQALVDAWVCYRQTLPVEERY